MAYYLSLNGKIWRWVFRQDNKKCDLNDYLK
jgi:hypothetical protein